MFLLSIYVLFVLSHYFWPPMLQTSDIKGFLGLQKYFEYQPIILKEASVASYKRDARPRSSPVHSVLQRNEQQQDIQSKQENRNMRRRKRCFRLYIHKTLRSIRPNCQLSKAGMTVMNSFMYDILQRVAEMAAHLVAISGRKTLICRDIETAVKLLLSGELMLHAVSEGTKAYARYTAKRLKQSCHFGENF